MSRARKAYAHDAYKILSDLTGMPDISGERSPRQGGTGRAKLNAKERSVAGDQRSAKETERRQPPG